MNPSAKPSLLRYAPLRHIISLPSAAFESELLPVLCFLHGYGEAAPMPLYDALTRHGPLQFGTSRLITERFIIVAPQLPVAGDIWHTKSAAIRQIVTTVQTEFRGNPNRTYLTGFSFGGNGVFDIAIAQPDLWAALWAVDPTRPPGGHLQHPLWLSLGEISRPKRTAFIELMKDAREARSRTRVSKNNFVFEDSGEDQLAPRESLMGVGEFTTGYLRKLDQIVLEPICTDRW